MLVDLENGLYNLVCRTMRNLIIKLLSLVNDGKINEEDCTEILTAIVQDNIDAMHEGLSSKPIEPISQITAEKLIENLKHCEK